MRSAAANEVLPPPGGSTAAPAVVTFYERHPYPPPVEDLAGYQTWWNDERRCADARLFWPDQQYRDNRRILVAGCGTSQAAKVALRWPQAHVTGIDVSATSIERTQKLKHKHHIDNLELQQLPVERASELASSFEHIICTGVLHHLSSPEGGLRALHDVLEPEGAMHLMVYAPYGRAGVYMLQEYCRRLGIGTSSEEIRALAATLGALPAGHPLKPLLRAPDFQDEAGLADALLHPQDRAYSVPQLFDFLASAGLAFGRWIRQAPYLVQCGLLRQTPHQSLLAKLPEAEQYAAAELFRGTMLTHSVVAYRSDRPRHASITFDTQDWLRYVPIRLPDTIAVQERLPPAAAAVLINRGHTDTDLYLPIDSGEKHWFEAIDGVKCIAEIAREDGERERARLFFERLWHYDQVVYATGNRP